jgi:ATP-dependent Clp protease ATP-binding subunit ClpC
MTEILKLMLGRVRLKIEAQGYKVEFSEETDKFLIKTGFDVNYGARPLARTIQRSIEDPLAEDMLMKKFEQGATIYVDLASSGEKLVFSTTPFAKVK